VFDQISKEKTDFTLALGDFSYGEVTECHPPHIINTQSILELA
jgi:hypothetical protein